MLRTRLIPILLIDGNRLVKTTRFSSPKYVGDPINTVHIFNEKEVDELMVLDITASKYDRDPNYELIEQLASECFMPLCYGGGIKSLQQVDRLFGLGIEKVSLQSNVILQPNLISAISDKFGSQATVISLDLIQTNFGKYKIYNPNITSNFRNLWQDLLTTLVSAGAGEVLLTSVKREGTGLGLDTNLIREAALDLSVPLIAHGGLGNLKHAKEAIDAGADAVAGGSFFVFQGKYKAVLITYPERNKLDELGLGVS